MSDLVLNGVSALIAATLCTASARLIAGQLTSAPRGDPMSEDTLEVDTNDAESLVVLQSSTLLTMRVPASSEDELLFWMLRTNIPVTPYQATAIAHVVQESAKALSDIQRCLVVAQQHNFTATARELQSQADRLQRIIDIRVASVAPIRRIPCDTLIRIFAYCVSGDDDTYDPTCTRWRIMRVCCTWRGAMINSTGLWHSLSVRFPVSAPAEVERFCMHLDCNTARPLNVYVNYISGTYTYEYDSRCLLSLLQKQSSRIRGLHIRICGDPHYIFRIGHHLDFPSLPNLEDITILTPRQSWDMNDSFIKLDAPKLKRARLFPYPCAVAGPIPFRQLTQLHVLINDMESLRLLESSPALQVLRLAAACSFESTFDDAPMHTYTSVTHLHIDVDLLPYVHAPNVKSLRVTHHRASGRETISEFLARSGQHVVNFGARGEVFLDSGDFLQTLSDHGGIETLEANVDPADMLHVVVAVAKVKRDRWKWLILRTDVDVGEADMSWEKEVIGHLCGGLGMRVDVRPGLLDDDWQRVVEEKGDWRWSDLPVDRW